MDTLKIFCSYAPKDKNLMERLDMHLRGLGSQRVSVWYAHNSLPGTDGERERDSQLRSADIILFLVSPDFIGSHEHYEKEVLPAMERYDRGEARVVPIILRSVHWREKAFGNLLPLPGGGKPVTDTSWNRLDDAFFNVVEGIDRVVQEVMDGKSAKKSSPPLQQGNYASPSHSPAKPNSSGDDVIPQLEQIIQNFKSLRQQIASFVSLNKPKEVTVEGCEIQYSKLYGDTMVFLALYFPESVSGDPGGFVELVHKDATARSRGGDIFSVVGAWMIRRSLSSVDKLVNLAAQVDACIATLELYKQKYFKAGHTS